MKYMQDTNGKELATWFVLFPVLCGFLYLLRVMNIL